jgi:hypothetical protein
MPADRAQIDDRATARRTHGGHGGLRNKELVLQVHRHQPVPLVGRDIINRMARIAGRIVDEHIAPAQRIDQPVMPSFSVAKSVTS